MLWYLFHLPYSDREMPGYDEKIDIWRVPDVLEDLLCDKDTGTCQAAKEVSTPGSRGDIGFHGLTPPDLVSSSSWPISEVAANSKTQRIGLQVVNWCERWHLSLGLLINKIFHLFPHLAFWIGRVFNR